MTFKFLRAILLAVPALVFAADPYAANWRRVADRLVEAPPDAFPFNWGEGVQMIGLMKIHERTAEPRYADYAEKWAALFTGRDLEELLKTGRQAAGPRPGYCGYWSPATAILLLHRARPKQEYLRLARGVAAFIRDGAERGPDGALGHWQGSHQLWVDTLYMACPLLSLLGKQDRRPELIDDAARQILAYARPLQNATTGLFYHMWDWQTRQRTADFWGRGNGWVLMSLADTLEAPEAGDPLAAQLTRVAQAQAKGLTATQDSDGLWHTVLDDPASYAECSASSMIVYGLLKLMRMGALPASYRRPALRAWKAVNERFVKDGLVLGVSAGTDPGNTSYYRGRGQGAQTWGTGAYLMAGSEVARLRQ